MVGDPKKVIVKDELDGIFQLKDNQPRLTLKNDDPTVSKALQMKIQQIFFAHVSQMNSRSVLKDFPKIETSYIYGNKDIKIQRFLMC